MRIDDAKLAELEALEKAATPGPWELFKQVDRGLWHVLGHELDVEVCVMTNGDQRADGRLICAMHSALPDLIADSRELHAKWKGEAQARDDEQALVWKDRAEKAEAERDRYRDAAERAETVVKMAGNWPQTMSALVDALATFPSGRVVLRDLDKGLSAAAERDLLLEALREVEKHVQIASCECLDLPKFSCCTCGAYEHAEALALVDRVLGIGVEP